MTEIPPPEFESVPLGEPLAEDLLDDRTAPVDLRELQISDPSVRFPVLVTIAGRERGRLFSLEKVSRLVIGRAPDVDIVIDDVGVSRAHAAIEVREKHIVIVDLGSRNGLLVNGLGIDEHLLEDGDRIQIGTNTVLKFAHTDELEERFQRELVESAIIDPLTGVHHRDAFLRRLQSECAFARRHHMSLSLVAFDLDGFAAFNRQHGHVAGNAVLAETGKLTRSMLRSEDVVGRLGNEGFVLLLRNLPLENALMVAQRLRDAISAQSFRHRGRSFSQTACFGAVELTRSHDDETVLAEALRRLKQAQNGGLAAIFPSS